VSSVSRFATAAAAAGYPLGKSRQATRKSDKDANAAILFLKLCSQQNKQIAPDFSTNSKCVEAQLYWNYEFPETQPVRNALRSPKFLLHSGIVNYWNDQMAKKARPTATKRVKRRAWTRADANDLRKHSRAKTPVAKIAKAMKRTPGALRQQARKMGMPLGHRR
jgi:hypothetical protein